MKNKLLIILLLTVLCGCSQKSAKISEVTKSIETYPFSDPDKVPKPDRNYYPYYRFDGYSKDSELAEWTIVEMENDYVKVQIFPEIGGKIWGAIEKSTGNEFIYSNSVVKFRNIAMRGPWTSGGIEFNFGIIGHTPHVSTPVDYTTRKNEDGSVSCFIGGIELMTRARWETEINLQPDKAYFTTRTTYSNPTAIVQPYYQWSNAAYQAEGGMEFLYPGNIRIGHGGEAQDWPVDGNGNDLSFYKNNAFGGDKSDHIVGTTDGFYGAYWHDLNFGTGQYSTYGSKLGKKIFLWSQARSGGIWEDLLTDDDGQYVELQSGRLFNQASTPSTRTPYKHFGFAPHASNTFEEYWFPIMEIGGAVKANNRGVLNVVKGNDTQNIYFSPLTAIKDEVKIYFGEKLVNSFNVNNKPLEVWEETIPLNSTSEPLKIIIGANELIYSENEEFASRPTKSPEEFDWNSVFGLYTDGINWIYQGQFERAFQSLSLCLEKDPLYSPALNSIAELYLRKGDLENALINVKRSLSINTYDAKANFIYGLINRQSGNTLDARDGFAVATLTPEYFISGNIELAKLSISGNELFEAKKYIDNILSKEPDNQDGLLLESLVLRKTDNSKEADKILNHLEKISPLNHFVRAERIFSKTNEKSKNDFRSNIKNELDYETYTEIALWYESIGCLSEAIQILELSPENALVNLSISNLYNKTGDSNKSEAYFERFLQNSTDLVMPFRVETIAPLEWAVEKTENWKPKYYLGLLHWSLGDKTEAVELFNLCGNSPDSPYFYLTKTDLFSLDKNYDPEMDILRAVELKKDEWRSYIALIDYYLSKNSTDKALGISKNALTLFPENDVIKYTNAKCLLANELYSECLEELENTVILPNEGSQSGRITYRLAAIMESIMFYRDGKIDDAFASVEKARIWPENLGVGRPYNVDERIELFLEAEYLLKKNQKEKADELFNEIVSYTENNHRRYSSTDYLYIVSLKKLGMNSKIGEFLTKWQQNSPNDPIRRWVVSMNNNNRQQARLIEQEITTESGGTPWDPKYSDTDFEIIKNIAPLF